MNQQRIIRILSLFAVGVVVLIMITSSTFITIHTGEKGVLFKKFSGGLDKDHVYGQGFHVVAPWNSMIVYDLREQIREETMDVLSSDGLPITVDISVRFNPTAAKLGYLHEEIGPDYAEKIVKDVVRSASREVIGKYTPEEVYSSKRDSVRFGIQHMVETTLQAKYIELKAVNLRSIKLPATIEQAIQTKLVQQQEKEQYEFRIAKERKEAERKRIEAEGIKAFQEIVNQGLSDQYLRWKGIEATQNLAESQNSKVVVIGSGKNGLPIILGE
ncbi:prohibitin family protein [Sphingobacteriales bacterium UPWRP_1]|nr:peptidase [Sphingobacteriales bacterium TSM_CSS]PSJ78661.1 prohibitin family protein [Sphingobacteriales bacterium UPWRP_1]